MSALALAALMVAGPAAVIAARDAGGWWPLIVAVNLLAVLAVVTVRTRP